MPTDQFWWFLRMPVVNEPLNWQILILDDSSPAVREYRYPEQTYAAAMDRD